MWTDGSNMYYSGDRNYETYPNLQLLPSSEAKGISKKRFKIKATAWSNSTDADGYYTYTVPVAMDMTFAPEVLPSGCDDNTFYTDTEKENFDLLEHCNLTSATTLVLYAKTKPSVDFYIYAKGVPA